MLYELNMFPEPMPLMSQSNDWFRAHNLLTWSVPHALFKSDIDELSPTMLILARGSWVLSRMKIMVVLVVSF